MVPSSKELCQETKPDSGLVPGVWYRWTLRPAETKSDAERYTDGVNREQESCQAYLCTRGFRAINRFSRANAAEWVRG